MAVTYTLGKDAVLTGLTGCVRNVTTTIESTSSVDVTCRNTSGGERKTKSTTKDATVEIEMLDGAPSVGDTLTLGIPNAGLSGEFVVQSVSRSEPLDDAVTYNVTCKLKEVATT